MNRFGGHGSELQTYTLMMLAVMVILGLELLGVATFDLYVLILNNKRGKNESSNPKRPYEAALAGN
jgi:hypothetical protein